MSRRHRYHIQLMRWDDAEVATLKRMWAEGKSYHEISQKFGCSPDAVQRKAERLGLTRRIFNRWSEERIARMSELWAQGYTAQAIGDLLEVSRSAVLGKLKREGLLGGDRTKASPKSKSRKCAAPPAPKRASAPLPPREPTPLPVREEQPRSNSLVSFHQLQDHHCRFPVGDPRDADFGFCGKPRAIGKVYCADCCSKAYQKAKVGSEPIKRAAA